MSLAGERIYLGRYGSPQSYRKFQKQLQKWFKQRDLEANKPDHPEEEQAPKLWKVTAETLREKRLAGSPITINELVLVYRRFTKEYYRKNGRVTRKASIIDEFLGSPKS